MGKTLKYVLFIGIPIVIFLIVAKKQKWIGGPEGTEVTTDEVATAVITETVIASGKIQPEIEVKISSEVSGEIISLPVAEGQKVEKGDLLVKINPDIYQAAVSRTIATVNSARAALLSAEASFTEAEKIYDRNKKLYEQKVISASEFDAIQRAYDVARLNVESAEFQLQSAQATANEARDNLARTTIYAPTSGTISMLEVEAGERVVGTAQMAGTEIMRIAGLEDMEVLVEVNENDIIRVSRNDTAIIEVDAYLDKKFKGVVTEIANSARLVEGITTDQVTNFEVKVRILKSSYENLMKEGRASPFRPGMTATVEIQTERKSDVLAVPIEAVTTRSDTSTDAKSYEVGRAVEGEDQIFEVVFVLESGKAALRVVETGIQDDTYIEIREGLEEGEEIITGPYSTVSKELVNGDKVVKQGAETEKEKS